MKEQLSNPVILKESFDEACAQGASWKPFLLYKVESRAVSGTLPKGTYYIGDIVKFITHRIRQELWGDGFNYENGIYKTSDNHYFAVGSAYEFSELKGSNRNLYPCPSGCIGIVAEEIVDPKMLQQFPDTVTQHTFFSDIQILFNTTGFHFFSKDQEPIKILLWE
jgi:hypothetical protein